MVEDGPQNEVLLSAAAMALVHDDEGRRNRCGRRRSDFLIAASGECLVSPVALIERPI